METIKTNTLVVGAGQAGVAMSEHLSNANIPHLVLERERIAERWRTGRWDSLVANGPAWHDRFPNMDFPDADPESFISKEAVADYFVAYAEQIKAPIRCGVEVLEVKRNVGKPGFQVQTSEGLIEATNIVAATGAFQTPSIPPIIPQDEKITQLHSFDYRNPSQLPDGAVLIVGAGSSGVQIADELKRAGKQVYLSVGPHARPPRAYRGRDFVWWLGVLGMWDMSKMKPGSEHITIAVSGAHGGLTIDFRELANAGICLLGRSENFKDGCLYFANDLAENIALGDEDYLKMLDDADDYVLRNGLDLPDEPEARDISVDPECVSNPIGKLNLAKAGVTSIIWATGFTQDYSWLKVNALDESGKPQHQRGVSSEAGVYFLGLPWQSRRGSAFIWGVWHDAKYLADQISIQSMYQDYHSAHPNKNAT